MSDIKLEVGQVWKSSEYEVSIKDVYESCNSKVIAYRRTVLNTSILDSMYHPEETFRKYYQTLITNADGTPHVKPNDYQAGDVWVFIPENSAILIAEIEGELKLIGSYDARPFPVAKSLLTSKPQDYKLIHREGVINAGV